MVEGDPPRSLAARAAAELALVRIATCYGQWEGWRDWLCACDVHPA